MIVGCFSVAVFVDAAAAASFVSVSVVGDVVATAVADAVVAVVVVLVNLPYRMCNCCCW